jgi:hypothetical protein
LSTVSTGPKISSRDPHVVGRIGEQRRLDVPATVVWFIGAAEHDSRAFGDSGVDVATDAMLLPLGDQRADVGGIVGGIADL